VLKKGTKLLKKGAKLLKKSASIFLPLNSRGFLKFNLMYFQRLFYEYGRLYVSKIKDSQQICPLSANIYLHKPYEIILLTILLKRVDKT
jgi:hypothetical protein